MKMKWENYTGTYWFEVYRDSGERVRFQTTVAAAGGCRETASRIARLCYVFIENGADRNAALVYRAEQYRKVDTKRHQLGLRDVRDLFKKVHGKAAAESPTASDEGAAPKFAVEPEPRDSQEAELREAELAEPAEPSEPRAELRPPSTLGAWKKQPSDSAAQSLKPGLPPGAPASAKRPGPQKELFRNLHGEVVSVSASSCSQKVALKPWAELEPSDVDLLLGDDIYSYERELKLNQRRCLEERIVRLEQMAQRTTLPLRKGSGIASASLEDAVEDMAESAEQEEGRGFDARFLQVFLALPRSERRHATSSEVGCLERVARLEDGAKFTMAERRCRLKERLWELRSASASKASGFLESWVKPTS